MRTYINQDVYLTEFNVHKKYATSDLLLDLVWTHCNIVADIALSLIQRNNLDQQTFNLGITVQAALLHDIGVYACDGFEWLSNEPPPPKPYIQHTVAGAWILQQEGFSADVVNSAYTHAGVGLSREDIKKYGLHLPEDDYLPSSPVQKIVCYASKFHSKTPKFKDADEIVQSLGKYGEAKQLVFKNLMNEFGVPDLLPIIEKYKEWHKGFQYETSKLMNMQTVNLNSAGIAMQTTL